MGKGNLILIGMPGCGKSSAGVVLAKALGLDFLDTDLLIQRRSGQRLCEILRARGDAAFRRLEEETLCQVDCADTVIATGGSAVYGEAAMAHLRGLGRILYLKLSCEAIEGRLGDLRERGITLSPGQSLRSLYQERVPLYERWADLTIDAEGLDIRQVIAAITAALAAEPVRGAADRRSCQP